MEYMFLPLKRYADFAGRSSRKEYWMFALLYFLLLAAVMALMAIVDAAEGVESISKQTGMQGIFLIFGIMMLGLIVPTIAVHVRRFHDSDRSGWFILLNFIPYVGGLIVLIFMCLDGTRGENRFGPDPKQGPEELADVFS